MNWIKADVARKGMKGFISAFCLLTFAFLSGCQSAQPSTPPPAISSTRQAAAIAVDYCQHHGLDWGQPVWIMQEMDGYYCEFGDGRFHNGLTVGYDGVVRP
jgi:hypothetical protein